MVQVIFCYLYHCCFYRERIGKEIKNTENCGRVEMSAESKFVPESNEEMEDTFELRKIINPAGTAQNINILGKFCGKRDVERLTSEQLQKSMGLLRQMLWFCLEAVFISAIPLWSSRDTKQQPRTVPCSSARRARLSGFSI